MGDMPVLGVFLSVGINGTIVYLIHNGLAADNEDYEFLTGRRIASSICIAFAIVWFSGTVMRAFDRIYWSEDAATATSVSQFGVVGSLLFWAAVFNQYHIADTYYDVWSGDDVASAAVMITAVCGGLYFFFGVLPGMI